MNIPQPATKKVPVKKHKRRVPKGTTQVKKHSRRIKQKGIPTAKATIKKTIRKTKYPSPSFLKENIEDEKQAHKMYLNEAEKIKSESTKEALIEIAEDEKEHRKILETIQKQEIETPVEYPNRLIKERKGKKYIEFNIDKEEIAGSTDKAILIKGEWIPRSQVIIEGMGKYQTIYVNESFYKKIIAEKPKKELAKISQYIDETNEKIRDFNTKLDNPDPFSTATPKDIIIEIKAKQRELSQLKERKGFWEKEIKKV